MPENKIREIGELQEILNSKLLREVINLHRDYLDKEVKKFVKAQNIIEAYAALGKLEDYNNILRLIEKRVDELKKEK